MPTDAYDPNTPYPTPNEDDALPPELAALHGRLEADGASWRRHLPSSEPLLERVVRAGPPRPRTTPLHEREFDLPGISTSSGTKGPVRMHIGHTRGFAAAAVTIAVIVLFAVLLRTFAPGSHEGHGGTAHATPTPATGIWNALDGLKVSSVAGNDLTLVPAPNNPNIVYAVTVSPYSLRRTEDGGATWHTVPLPTDASQLGSLQAFVSPIDAHTIFVTTAVYMSPADAASCPTLDSQSLASVSAPLHGGIQASGGIPCGRTYRSSDNGAQWKLLTFPTAGVITVGGAMFLQPENIPLQRQGNVLYALLGCGTLCLGGENHIVRSADGGLSWRRVDSPLSSLSICDFAAAPTGNGVYSATATNGCSTDIPPPLTLWHSSDAGGHWSSVGPMPAGGEIGLAAAKTGSAIPLLYASIPSVVPQPHTNTITLSPAQFFVSADGGKSWSHAPVKGPGAQSQPFAAPITILADGSLVSAFAPSDGSSSPKVYSWKRGETSWKQVTAPIPGNVQSVVMSQDPTSGRTTYWAVIMTPEVTSFPTTAPAGPSPTPTPIGSPSSFLFTVLKYTS